MTVKFREVGNSITITIPKDIVSEFNIVPGKEADILVNNNSIVVKPKTQKVTIKSLFANYTGSYKPTEIDWGSPRGKEVW